MPRLVRGAVITRSSSSRWRLASFRMAREGRPIVDLASGAADASEALRTEVVRLCFCVPSSLQCQMVAKE